ncbi:MAG: DUF1223 domain-containing protein [Propionivibrio sp.]|uniref:DUF1223 domain-containing protein n=1 Tax=Propionivibrio sp. TaxID=2212460 RepID=UPI001A541993|nr:DUF1223 domain-containing protein [Propionivibrio sp.]MBL8415745.1 DUF1223 domain-containing protein [Propionivibrio sp.]
MSPLTLFHRATVSFCLALAPLAAQAAACSAHSPAHGVALIELYTSEGCSSCPPADRWLGELSRRFTAEQAVALSLHVDYWDYIGWKDPFAQARFSERQRWLSQLAASSTIYTPEVFAGMKELRGWNRHDVLEQRIQAINRQPARARIGVQMSASGSAAVDLEARFALVDGARSGAAAQGIVIVFEKKLSTEVRAGENKGARLEHDNVVRYWSAPVMLDAQTGRAEWRQTVKLPADWKRENLGIAALVQDAKAGEVLQAVSMPGCV